MGWRLATCCITCFPSLRAPGQLAEPDLQALSESQKVGCKSHLREHSVVEATTEKALLDPASWKSLTNGVFSLPLLPMQVANPKLCLMP